MPKITKRTVDDLTAHESKPTFLWDEVLSGFGVKALPSGWKRYVIKYRAEGGGRGARQRWLTLGTHGAITPDQARKLAQQTLAAIAMGNDPQQLKMEQRLAPTLEHVWTRYESEHLPQRKPSTVRDYKSQWAKLIEPKFGNAKVASISRSQIDKFHKGMKSAPYRANRTLALMSRLMTLAELWDMRISGSNPCRQIEKFNEESRERYLTSDELLRLATSMRELSAKKLITQSSAHAIWLLLMTGTRLNELLTARWGWVDAAQSVISLPDSKSGKKSVYLSEAAKNVLADQRKLGLGSEFIFPGTGKAGHMINLRKPWTRICDRASINGVRLHDLRHTAASIAAGQGASLPIIGRVLGHSQAQTTQRYAHVGFDPALEAVNAIGDVLSEISKASEKRSAT